MTDREALIALAKAVDLALTGLLNQLVGVVGTYPDAPVVRAHAEVQALIGGLLMSEEVEEES